MSRGNLIRLGKGLMTGYFFVFAISALPNPPARASTTNTISSGFSLGYGIASGFVWDTSETSGANTNVTSLFALTATPSGSGGYSFTGPTFPNRVLTNGGGSSESDYTLNFSDTLNGSWTGAAPLDALPVPNYHIAIDITSMSIWGVDADGHVLSTMYFTETTPGTGESSPVFNFATHGGLVGVAGNYNQLIWNSPPDLTPVSGTTTSRSFVVGTTSTAGYVVIDGFEVSGNVNLTYDTPEPASLGLLMVGGLVLLRRRR